MGSLGPMGNEEHLKYLRKGVDYWNSWRKEYPAIQPVLRRFDVTGMYLAGVDLSNADLYNVDFSSANLERANLKGAHLILSRFDKATLDGATFHSANLIAASFRDVDMRNLVLENADLKQASFVGANFSGSDLRGFTFLQAGLQNANLREVNLRNGNLRFAKLTNADLTKAELTQATLRDANLEGANLTEAYLSRTDFTDANLSGAILSKARLAKALFVKTDLSGAIMHDTDFEGASLLEANLRGSDISGSRIYGVSAWNLHLEGAKQNNLIITSANEPTITVDNIEVAQFVYLLLNNSKIRNVIDTITSKTVLILGRFTPERKAILDALRRELRKRDYLPILFDFDKPGSRDLTETVSTLAHMARFIIADITEAKSIPQELQAIVPNLPSVVIQPIILSSEYEYGMFEHFRRYPWVLNIYRYDNTPQLLNSLEAYVIAPAERKVQELR